MIDLPKLCINECHCRFSLIFRTLWPAAQKMKPVDTVSHFPFVYQLLVLLIVKRFCVGTTNLHSFNRHSFFKFCTHCKSCCDFEGEVMPHES